MGSFTNTVAYLTSSTNPALVRTGVQLGQVPNYMVTAGVEWRPIENLVLTASMKSFPQYWNDTGHTQLNDGATLIDLGVRWSPAKDVDVYGSIQNLTNVQYLASGYTLTSFEGSTVSAHVHPAARDAADRDRRLESEVLMRPVACACSHSSCSGPPPPPSISTASRGSTPEAFTATPAFAPDGTLWVVRPDGRPHRRAALDRPRQDVRRAGHGDARAHEPRLGTRCAGAHRRRSQRPAGRHLRHLPGQELQRPRLLRPLERRRRLVHASRVRSRPTRPASASRSRASTPTGRVFAAWLDKRNVAKARAAGRAYPGAALAYAWEDGDADFGNTAIALDNTCECCRLGLAFAGAGRPAVVFRNIFPGSVRDHGVITFRDPDDAGTGAPRQRRRLEDRGLPASRPQPGDRARRLVPRRLVHRRRRAQGPVLRPRRFGRRALLPAAALVGGQPPAVAALSSGQRPGAASRVEGVRRRQGGGALADEPRQRSAMERRRAPSPRRRTLPTILCSSPTSSAPTCRGSPRTRAIA